MRISSRVRALWSSVPMKDPSWPFFRNPFRSGSRRETRPQLLQTCSPLSSSGKNCLEPQDVHLSIQSPIKYNLSLRGIFFSSEIASPVDFTPITPMYPLARVSFP